MGESWVEMEMEYGLTDADFPEANPSASEETYIKNGSQYTYHIAGGRVDRPRMVTQLIDGVTTRQKRLGSNQLTSFKRKLEQHDFKIQKPILNPDDFDDSDVPF